MASVAEQRNANPAAADRPAGNAGSGGNAEVFSLVGVSWEAYCALRDSLDANGQSRIRLTYDDGRLDLMSPLPIHDDSKMLLHAAVLVLCDEYDVPRRSLGSTTFRSQAQRKGFEPDHCYFLTREKLAALPRGRFPKDFGIATVPPPDLAIEVDVTNSSVPRLPLHAAWGIDEVWRSDDEGERVTVLRRTPRGDYEEAESGPFPGLTCGLLTEALALDFGDEREWMEAFRRLVRERLNPPRRGS